MPLFSIHSLLAKNSMLTCQSSDPHSPFFFGPFFWESSSPFFSSPESSDLAFRFSLLSSLLSLFSFDSFDSFLTVVFLGAWRGNRFRHLKKGCRNSSVHQKRIEDLFKQDKNYSGLHTKLFLGNTFLQDMKLTEINATDAMLHAHIFTHYFLI